MNNQIFPEMVLDHVCYLGEGPVWDDIQQSVLWLDIKRGQIHSYTIDTGRHEIFETGEMIGCLAPRISGGYIAGLQSGIAFIDPQKKNIQHLADPEADMQNRWNDGKCDAAGRFWVGSMALDESEGKGSLYTVEKNLVIKKKLDKLTISNGLAWNAGNTLLYFINTPVDYVFIFDFEMETGAIRNRRVAVDLTKTPGHPDGMTIDEEGMLWVAMYGGGLVLRCDPASGKILQRISLSVSNVTSCSFGGKGLDDLYITTASQNLQPEELKKQPQAGKLFVAPHVGVRGFLPNKFGG
jgi:sugar lactone lactonase YvrE